MTIVCRAYISTFHPTKFDNVPREIYQPLKAKWAYGVKVFIQGEPSNIASSWVKSKEPMLPLITGLSNLLSVIEVFDEPPQIDLLTRSAHIGTRITQVENRLRKKQQGKAVGPLKNERLWEDTTRRYQLYKKGSRESMEPHEIRELESIENVLRKHFYEDNKFSSAHPPEFQLIFPDA